MKKINLNKAGYILLAILILLFSYACDVNSKTKITEKVSNVVFLEQGLSKDEMLSFYSTPQGSQLLPYSWFCILEQVNSKKLFRDNKHIKSLGYIPQDAPTPECKREELPIGFVKDEITEAFLDSALNTNRLSPRPQGNQNVWLGLTCAACHTSEINYGGKTLRINGGHSQISNYL
jgi:hypothetical protein